MENLSEQEVLKHRTSLIESKILTRRQCEVLEKRSKNIGLSSTEKTYYYKFIRPKLKMISCFQGDDTLCVMGSEQMIFERIEEAKRIILRLEQKHKNQKILLSGSFLFKEKYKDIDVFVISKYAKENYRFRKMQISFLKEKDLDTLFFASLAQMSVANFKPVLNYAPIVTIEDFTKNYELLVNAFLQKDDLEPYLRTFLLHTSYLSIGVILNPLQLSELREKFFRFKNIEFIRQYVVYALLTGYTKVERKRLRTYIQDYKLLKREYKSTNIHEYIKTYEMVMKVG